MDKVDLIATWLTTSSSAVDEPETTSVDILECRRWFDPQVQLFDSDCGDSSTSHQ